MGAVEAAPARAVELLYFDGCPHYEQVLTRLRELMLGAGVPGQVRLRVVPDEPAAVREHFLGSPTVRVDGQDVEPGADERVDFGMRCRLYATVDGLRPTPPDEWVLDALTRRGSAGTSRGRPRGRA